MSTVVVVKKAGQIVIAADTMTKLGRVREGAEHIVTATKILQVGRNYFAHVGHCSFGMVLESHFSTVKSRLKLDLDSARAVFEMARELHPVLKDKYFLNPTEDSDDPFESSQHQYLIASPHGIFGVYALRSVQEYTKFYSFGTGSEFALGAMQALYDLDLSAQEIARKAVEVAATFDDSTGLPIEIKTIEGES